jgi:riboflavin kinase/FMN adenylyltransferase
VEAHLLDFAGDLYGQDMTVRFRDRIRDERKFKSVEELVRQIEKDVGYARSAQLPTNPEADDAAFGGRPGDGGQ